MKLIVLVENETNNPDLETRKGLSLYIETAENKLLFDAGPDASFISNAKMLGVDLTNVDTAIISHGHNDHGGGLPYFLDLNDKARVYAHELAFGNYVVYRGVERYIGLDKELIKNGRISLVSGDIQIGNGLKLMTVDEGSVIPGQNKGLFERKDNGRVPDEFHHELNLLISEGNKNILVTGCAHRGIVNIIESISKRENIRIDYVIGGFHLNKFTGEELTELGIAEKLRNIGAKYITGHCTGTEQFISLKKTLKEDMQYLSTGTVLEIN